jgi:hypothetical protein
MKFDFSDWAVVARKDDTGFGRCAADIRNVLGLGYHFVCPSDRIEGRPPTGQDEFWLNPDFSNDELAKLLRMVKGIIFFETYGTWHPELLRVARACNVKTVCVPMWEWFRGEDPMCYAIFLPVHLSSLWVSLSGMAGRMPDMCRGLSILASLNQGKSVVSLGTLSIMQVWSIEMIEKELATRLPHLKK